MPMSKAGSPDTKARYAAIAARNNAAWCDTVCRTHGVAGEFREGLWVSRGVPPPFYPNAVTLEPGPDRPRERLRALIREGMPAAWAVKDSFADLGLAPLGFRFLFSAEWIYRESVPPCEPLPENIAWTAIATPQDLAGWHAAWNSDYPSGIFLPALLEDENVAVLAALRDERIVAGAIANLASGVVGISNLFVSGDDHRDLRRGLIAEASRRFPGHPLVGYERGDDLAEMLSIGFEAIGPLRVWLYEAPPGAAR